MLRLLIATTNPGKKEEFVSLLAHPAIQPVFPADLGLQMEVEETGTTYRENALLKADALCKASGMITLADDTGLEVAALGGRPGLYSARYAHTLVNSDGGRRQELLRELAAYPRPWNARFVCVAAVARPGLPTLTFEGQVGGEIIPQERGEFGFGYDRIFYIPAVQKTMAELGMDEKNLYSHRALAVKAALVELLKMID